MYARDDADMERYELAHTIHQERMRALEIALHRRRLLRANDDVARTAADGKVPADDTVPAGRPTAAQPAGSSPRRSTPLAR
jgi:hypothetical protein